MKTVFSQLKLDVLRPGDWIEFNYGYQRLVFYVLRNDPLAQRIWVTRKEWLVSAATGMRYAEINGDDLAFLRQYGQADYFEPNPVYLGRTKKRWWWRFVPFRDLVCPFKPWRIL